MLWSWNVCVLLIAIGFMNGMVRLVDSLSLEDCTAQPFNNTHREAITHITFSDNCEYFATAVSRILSTDDNCWLQYVPCKIIISALYVSIVKSRITRV